MSTNHRGNTQPAIDQEEHLHLNDIAGKKVYNIDSSGNVLNFESIDVPAITSAVDGVTTGLKTVDYPHHEVHDGNFYRSGFNYALGNGEVATISLTTPNTAVWCHIVWTLTTTADGTFTVLEDVESLAGGASVTPLNHNRNSENTSDMVLTRGMTGVDLITPTGGTTILNAALPTARGSTVDRNNSQEFVLKQDSIYLFRYTNGTTAQTVQFIMEWYEHESVE